MYKTFILTLFSVLLMLSCKQEEKKQEELSGGVIQIALSKKQVEVSGISMGALVSHKMSEVITANGLVDVPPQHKASVSTILGGFVKSTNVLEGDHVHKGEVLAVLTHPDYIQLQQQFLEFRSRQLIAGKELQRQKELREENINSRKKLEEAEAEFKITAAQTNALEARLKMIGLDPEKVASGDISSSIEIRSPLTGDVSFVNVTIGKFVRPEETMFEIIGKEHLHLELHVYEKDVLKVKPGQTIKFMVSNDGQERLAKVILVGKNLNTETRTVSIHGHPEENSEGLLPGMYINARILAEEKTVPALSEEAIIKEGAKEYIFVKSSENNDSWIFKKVTVETGFKEGGLVEIKSPDLNEYNGKIIIKGAYYIYSQMSKEQLEK